MHNIAGADLDSSVMRRADSHLPVLIYLAIKAAKECWARHNSLENHWLIFLVLLRSSGLLLLR